MYHFFVKQENIDRANNRVVVEGEDYNHIRNVLRMHPGEELSVGTGEDDDEYRVEIAGFEDGKVICNLMFIKHSGVESPVETVLYQGLPKADKMELIIQKCVELGVSRIVPVACKRSVVKLDGKKASDKIKRWQAIAEAASKQSRRAIIPVIGEIRTMDEALKEAAGQDIRMIPYELEEGMGGTKEIFEAIRQSAGREITGTESEGTNSAGNTFTGMESTERKIMKRPRVAVFIGPEGGFAEEEVRKAKEAGVVPVSLGKRILRTETAGMMVLSWIAYVTEAE